MKLLCINAKIIEFPKLGIEQTGKGLVEDKIYTTRAKPFKNKYGQDCYYIDGLGSKLKMRFAELLDENGEEKSSIEEELDEAIKNEDYEKASKLRDKLK